MVNILSLSYIPVASVTLYFFLPLWTVVINTQVLSYLQFYRHFRLYSLTIVFFFFFLIFV